MRFGSRGWERSSDRRQERPTHRKTFWLTLQRSVFG